MLDIPLSVALFGQTEQNAVPNPGDVIARAVGGIGTNGLGLARLAAAPPSQPSRHGDATPKCSVPLWEMKIPDDKNFTLLEVEPPPDFADHMAVPPPAPACPTANK